MVRPAVPSTCRPTRLEWTCSRTRTNVCMNAVPISPPNNRLICSRQPIASASAGLIERTIRTSSAVSAKDWPIACRICDGRKSSVAHWLVSSVAIQQATPISSAAERQHPAPVDPAQQGRQRQGDDELRQGDPQQHAADLQFAKILHGLQVGRDDVGGRKDDEAEAGQQQHQQQQIAAQQSAQDSGTGAASSVRGR